MNEALTSYIPSTKKYHEAKFGESTIGFTYRLQNIESKSPVLRKELEKWDHDSGGLIGVVFDDNSVAWSTSVPRHTNLISAEKKIISARFQTHLEPFSMIPLIQIDTLTKKCSSDLLSFFERSNVIATTFVKINLTDRLDGQPTQNSDRVYFGPLGKFNHKKFEEDTLESISETY